MPAQHMSTHLDLILLGRCFVIVPDSLQYFVWNCKIKDQFPVLVNSLNDVVRLHLVTSSQAVVMLCHQLHLTFIFQQVSGQCSTYFKIIILVFLYKKLFQGRNRLLDLIADFFFFQRNVIYIERIQAGLICYLKLQILQFSAPICHKRTLNLSPLILGGSHRISVQTPAIIAILAAIIAGRLDG